VKVRAIVESRDFFNVGHRLIFRAMCSVADKGEAVDVVTVGAELGRKVLTDLGGAMMLMGLADYNAHPASVVSYCRLVKSNSMRRDLMSAAHKVYRSGFANTPPTREYLAKSRKELLEVIDSGVDGKAAQSIGDTIYQTAEEIFSKETPRGLIRTGISTLDRNLGGLWPGLLTVLAARPAMGKSMVALNIALNAGLADKKTLLYSLEDTGTFVRKRILSRLAKVPLDKMIKQTVSIDERKRIEAKLGIAAAAALYIDDRPGLLCDDITASAAAHKDARGLDLIIVDHLGHIHERGHRNLYEATTIAARKMTAMAKDLDVPVLLLCQLNRAAETRTDDKGTKKKKKPMMADLRQSGEIEQLARAVWLLYRPHYYDEEASETELWLDVAKNSHGPTGSMELRCDLEHMSVGDKDESGYRPY
jgi:replicative DNA helicase